tara:strand:- start:715 stop:1314 length:600 start_codon:yes stop_codon:yes gene_type:complete
MKNLLLFAFSVFTFSAIGTNLHIDQVRVDVEKSKINWKGSKITESHEGTVNIGKGVLMIEHGVLVGGQLSIDMNTISTTDMNEKLNKRLDRHLKNADFFDVEKFQMATIKIISVERIKKDGKHNLHTVLADLTIKGITHPIKFKAEVKINGLNLQATAKIKIDRTKWDVRYNSGNFFQDLGDKLILDEIEFDVSLFSVK